MPLRWALQALVDLILNFGSGTLPWHQEEKAENPKDEREEVCVSDQAWSAFRHDCPLTVHRFDWDAKEDTSQDYNPLYQRKHEAQFFGRGSVAGIDVAHQRKVQAGAWLLSNAV